MKAMAMQMNPMMPMLGQTNAAKLRARDTTAGAGTTGTGSATGGTAGATGTGANSSSLASSTNDIGTTFLSLLVQELQNQDPTAPMDSTAMVGQMISLNQLDQLTSINQVLTDAYGGTTGSGSASGSATSGVTGGSTNGSVIGSVMAGGATGGLPGTTSGQSLTGSATEAAMRLLQGGTPTVQPKVSTSVSLPGSARIF